MDDNGVTVETIVRDGRTTWVTDAQNNVTRKEANEKNNLVLIVYPDETWIKYEYVQPWNLLSRKTHMDLVTEYEYDANGCLAATIEAKGSAVERRTEYSYSDTGKLLSQTVISTSADNATTTNVWDDKDNLLSVTDPAGRTISFPVYDIAGNPLTVEDGRDIQKYLEYDDAGNLRFIKEAE